MKKIVSAGLLALCMMFVVPAFATAPMNHGALVGVWVNTNPATRSIVRVIIRKAGTGITVHPFGACSPTPCDHGVMSADAFARAVTSSVSVGFNAEHNFGFKMTSYNGYLQGRRLALLTQNTFAAGDSRMDYTVLETFRRINTRVPAEPAVSSPVLDHGSETDLQ